MKMYTPKNPPPLSPISQKTFKATAGDVILSLLKRTCKMTQTLTDDTNGNLECFAQFAKAIEGDDITAVEYGRGGGRTWRDERERTKFVCKSWMGYEIELFTAG